MGPVCTWGDFCFNVPCIWKYWKTLILSHVLITVCCFTMNVCIREKVLLLSADFLESCRCGIRGSICCASWLLDSEDSHEKWRHCLRELCFPPSPAPKSGFLVFIQGERQNGVISKKGRVWNPPIYWKREEAWLLALLTSQVQVVVSNLRINVRSKKREHSSTINQGPMPKQFVPFQLRKCQHPAIVRSTCQNWWMLTGLTPFLTG